MHPKRSSIVVALLALLFAMPGIAEKLKTYYSGSAQTADGAARLIMLQLSPDGTAILQQDDEGKPSIKQRVHWNKKGDKLILTFDPAAGESTPAPLYFQIKNNTLIPQTENATGLGVLGYPTLQPFGNQ